jgi:methionyl-tRNA formyltransferase
MTQIVFMGSPKFAVPSLEALVTSHDVVGVVTQPDRPAGRGGTLRRPPVKVAAQAYGLPVFQPPTLRSPEALAQLRAWEPTLIVVAAFGQILTYDVLELPPYGCLNVHPSLLPRWRGPAPVPAAIMAGDEITGVTIMKLDPGVDTGPILSQREEPVRPTDTAATLLTRLSHAGAELLVETIPPYLAGELAPRPQPETGVIYSQELEKEDGRLDWNQPAIELDRQIRAVTPWPGAFTTWKGRRLKVLAATPLPDHETGGLPGTVVTVGRGAGVVTGRGVLQLLEVQRAGKRALPIRDFLNGYQDFVGSRLGEG